MDNTKTLETERLILRKFTIEDAEGTVPVHNGCHDHHPSGCGCDDAEISDNVGVDTDGIEDANY